MVLNSGPLVSQMLSFRLSKLTSKNVADKSFNVIEQWLSTKLRTNITEVLYIAENEPILTKHAKPYLLNIFWDAIN